MLNLESKEVLVTGATGMIGIELVRLLRGRGANVLAVSLDKPEDLGKIFEPDVRYIHGDLRDFDFCMEVCQKKDIVFHVAGIKGSPEVALGKPYTFFYNTSSFNLNVIEASRRSRVEHFLYTSSVGVYAPAEIFDEDTVWNSFPSKNDTFAGWAKRMGELQLEAAKLEHGWNNTYIIRPANVYGAWDNFDTKSAMVIPSLIARLASGENPLTVWGDGSAVRDFVHSRDVARAMLHLIDKGIHVPVNVGSGTGVSIRKLSETLCKVFGGVSINWDREKPTGDLFRVMNTARLFKSGFHLEVDLETGLSETVEWFLQNRHFAGRYNAFTEAI